MRQLSILVVSLLLGISVVTAQETPKRKAGLWEVTRTSTYTQNQPRSIKVCVGDANDNPLQQLAEGMRGETCTTNKMSRDGDKLQVDATCKLRASTSQTHAVVTGKFDSAYSIQSKSTYNPPLAGHADGQAQLSAKWAGPCPAGLNAGEMILNNGQKADSSGEPEERTKGKANPADKKKGLAPSTPNPMGPSPKNGIPPAKPAPKPAPVAPAPAPVPSSQPPSQ